MKIILALPVIAIGLGGIAAHPGQASATAIEPMSASIRSLDPMFAG